MSNKKPQKNWVEKANEMWQTIADEWNQGLIDPSKQTASTTQPDYSAGQSNAIDPVRKIEPLKPIVASSKPTFWNKANDFLENLSTEQTDPFQSFTSEWSFDDFLPEGFQREHTTKEEDDINKDKIIVNLNDNPKYQYVDYDYAESKLGDKFVYKFGKDTSWVECYGAARYEILINGFNPGILHGETSRKFDISTKEQKRKICLEIESNLNKGIPVLCAINVWEDNIEDTRKNNGDTKADHFVVIVGYGVTPKGERFYLFNENAGGNGQAKGKNTQINRIYRRINQKGNIFLRAPSTTWVRGVSSTGDEKEVKRNYEVTNIIFSLPKK